MFAKCSHSQCGAPFDFREGQLIQFCKSPLDDQSPSDQHRVEHFWLCGIYSKLYVFEHIRGVGMKIKLRVRETQEEVGLSFVTAG
jgi:hypothetical protein